MNAGYVGLMANLHAIGHAFHITTDESMTCNQSYQSLCFTLMKPLIAQYTPSVFSGKVILYAASRWQKGFGNRWTKLLKGTISKGRDVLAALQSGYRSCHLPI